MREAIARVGRLYLIILMVVVTALLLVTAGVFFYEAVFLYEALPGGWQVQAGFAMMLTAALLNGVTAWGVIRRKRWSYYLSLIVTLYWFVMAVLPLFDVRRQESPAYVAHLISVALWLMALVALVLPGVRAEFMPAGRDGAQQAAPLHS